MEIFDFIKDLHWQTIIGMFAICWYFTRDINETCKEIRQDIKEQSLRTDKLYEIFVEQQKEFDKKFYDMLKEKKG